MTSYRGTASFNEEDLIKLLSDFIQQHGNEMHNTRAKGGAFKLYRSSKTPPTRTINPHKLNVPQKIERHGTQPIYTFIG